MIAEMIPINPTKSIMKNYLYSYTDNLSDFAKKDVVDFWKITGEEDLKLCEYQQIGNTNPFFDKPKIFSKIDRINKNYMLEYNKKIEGLN